MKVLQLKDIFRLADADATNLNYFKKYSAHIKILPSRQIPLYQKISLKAKQLHTLGMSYQQIAKNLNVGPTTVIRACKYK